MSISSEIFFWKNRELESFHQQLNILTLKSLHEQVLGSQMENKKPYGEKISFPSQDPRQVSQPSEEEQK